MPSTQELYDKADKLKDDGKYDEAIATLNELLASDESFTLAHLALAVILGRVDKHDEAVKHGERACELEPDEAFNFTAMSVTYQRAYAGTGNQQFIQMAEDAMAKAHALQQG